MRLLRVRRPRFLWGFTLPEAVIGVAIATLGSISTISVLMFARLHNSEEQERARANQIVCERMERVHLELFSAITAGEDVVVWNNGTPEDPSDDTHGTLSVIIRNGEGHLIAATPVPWERVQVEVTLAWRPRGRRDSPLLRESLMTFLAPKGN